MKDILKLLSNDSVYFPSSLLPHPFNTRHLFMAGTVGLLKERSRPIKVLEIGSWIGSSALTWASAINEFIPNKGALLCVDPWLPYNLIQDSGLQEDTKTRDERYVRLGPGRVLAEAKNMRKIAESEIPYNCFLHNISYIDFDVQVDHMRGTSGRILPYLQSESFDIVYIDGNHYYENVLFDMKQADRLLVNEGFVCGDDLEMQYDQIDQNRIQDLKITDYFRDPKTGKAYHPGVTLAVHEIFGKASSYNGYWIMKKTGDGYQQVNLHPDRLLTTLPFYMNSEERDRIIRQISAIKI